jgi:hypothetical protein
MKRSFRFQQNPAGINQMLMVEPESVYFLYQPPPLFSRPRGVCTEQTFMVLHSQAFVLNGDFRQAYEQALAQGGVSACIQLYLQNQAFACQWSSRRDPWKTAAELRSAQVIPLPMSADTPMRKVGPQALAA